MQIEVRREMDMVRITKRPTETRTQKYLTALQAKMDLRNANQIATYLGVNRVAVSRWVWGQQNFSDEIALRVAKELDVDPTFILAEMQAERTNGAVKAVWEKLVDDWRKRSNPPRLRLHQARQKRIREAPKFGAFSFVPSPKRRMAGLVRAVNRALYRTLTQPHSLRNPRHGHTIGMHA